MPAAIEGSPPTALPPLLTTSDIVRLIGISRVTIWRLEKGGTFPKPIVIGKSKRWQRADVAAFLDAHKSV
ncbi:helix-turn-helix transcriptional regulator [Aureimonas leprariae]|uniref:Helix-turn-helix domain-containing protein n=1 Tax=Plantimonas leprariae TaxID=2615207 RepID=A0A7V7PKD3_9HYPH|nr:helix-turn-helix domain-containing protein [Aureimonas leprariae]KAB0676002.1 helix-turn-helix domain-containing protein [Aureimonas leprariae]